MPCPKRHQIRRSEYRVGLKSGQGMYIIARNKDEARKAAIKDYYQRYMAVGKPYGHRRATAADKRHAASRIESVKLWRKQVPYYTIKTDRKTHRLPLKSR